MIPWSGCPANEKMHFSIFLKDRGVFHASGTSHEMKIAFSSSDRVNGKAAELTVSLLSVPLIPSCQLVFLPISYAWRKWIGFRENSLYLSKHSEIGARGPNMDILPQGGMTPQILVHFCLISQDRNGIMLLKGSEFVRFLKFTCFNNAPAGASTA